MPWNEGGERKPFLGLPLLVMVLWFLIWGPVSFDLILDLPNPEPRAPDGARCGRTARRVVVLRRVPGEQIPFPDPGDELPSDSTGADIAEERRFYLFQQLQLFFFTFSLGFTGENQLVIRQRVKALGQTRCKHGENTQFPFPYLLLSSLVQDLFHFLISLLIISSF